MRSHRVGQAHSVAFRFLRIRISLALSLLIWGCPTPPQPRQITPNTFLRDVQVNGQWYSYLLFIPDHYDRSQPGPLLLYWHGLWQAGRDGPTPLTQGIGPVLVQHPELYPCLVALPQLHYIDSQQQDEDEYDAVLEDIIANFPIDQKRMYVTGASTGGGHALEYVAHHPGEFAAVIPVSWSVGPEYAPLLTDIPIYAFQGAFDWAHPVREMRQMVAAIQAAGGNILYKEFPGANHQIFDRVYSDPNLISWMLSQSLK